MSAKNPTTRRARTESQRAFKFEDQPGPADTTGPVGDGLVVLQGVNTITLTRGKNTLVDAIDWPELSKEKWCAVRTGNGPFYAIRKKQRDHKITIFRIHQEVLKAAQVEIPPGMEIDHRNRDSLDNRRDNLRLATRSQNTRNCSTKGNVKAADGQSRKTSKYRGVCWQKTFKKWNAQINKDRKTINLGYFDSEIEAARVYNSVAEELFGEFAQLNEGI